MDSHLKNIKGSICTIKKYKIEKSLDFSEYFMIVDEISVWGGIGSNTIKNPRFINEEKLIKLQLLNEKKDSLSREAEDSNFEMIMEDFLIPSSQEKLLEEIDDWKSSEEKNNKENAGGDEEMKNNEEGEENDNRMEESDDAYLLGMDELIIYSIDEENSQINENNFSSDTTQENSLKRKNLEESKVATSPPSSSSWSSIQINPSMPREMDLSPCSSPFSDLQSVSLTLCPTPVDESNKSSNHSLKKIKRVHSFQGLDEPNKKEDESFKLIPQKSLLNFSLNFNEKTENRNKNEDLINDIIFSAEKSKNNTNESMLDSQTFLENYSNLDTQTGEKMTPIDFKTQCNFRRVDPNDSNNLSTPQNKVNDFVNKLLFNQTVTPVDDRTPSNRKTDVTKFNYLLNFSNFDDTNNFSFNSENTPSKSNENHFGIQATTPSSAESKIFDIPRVSFDDTPLNRKKSKKTSLSPQFVDISPSSFPSSSSKKKNSSKNLRSSFFPPLNDTTTLGNSHFVKNIDQTFPPENVSQSSSKKKKSQKRNFFFFLTFFHFFFFTHFFVFKNF